MESPRHINPTHLDDAWAEWQLQVRLYFELERREMLMVGSRLTFSAFYCAESRVMMICVPCSGECRANGEK